MSDYDSFVDRFTESRRSVLKKSALAGGGFVLGASGTASAGSDGDGASGEVQSQARRALMANHEFRPGAVFRVKSPPLEELPNVGNQQVFDDPKARVIEYFNTNEEVQLIVPTDADVQEGNFYQLGDQFAHVTGGQQGEGLVQVEFRPVDYGEFNFDIAKKEGFEPIRGTGGEGAVRPSNFHTGALFRITSSSLGWVPSDVEQSGLFTDYNTHHAEFLGTDGEFLFWPQEDVQVETDAVYVMWDEFEFLDPVGNLVAVQIRRVDESSIEAPEEAL